MTYHKQCLTLGLFYFSLANIDPALRSKLNLILLLSVVEVSSIDKYGINEILKPVVAEIEQLESVRIYQ